MRLSFAKLKTSCKSQIILALVTLTGTLVPAHARVHSHKLEADQDKGTQEWKRYTAGGEEFSVLLPVLPAMTTDSIYVDPKQGRRERTIAAYADGVVYVIFTYERKGLTRDKIIQKLAKEDFTETGQVTVDGVSGRRYNFENDDRMGVIQFFTTEKNFYVFEAIGSKLGNPSTAIPKFLSSISFSKNADGTKVEDGPGEQTDESHAQVSKEVVNPEDVHKLAWVITKPEPRYTERARMSQVVGTVVLGAVFSSSGAVTNISTIKGKPLGLTEQAIESARKIRFVPAIKDGRFVSVRLQLEYTFNLY